MYTFETGGGNEPKTFTSKLTSMETSSSEESVRSIKVDEGKCKDETRVICFTLHVSQQKFQELYLPHMQLSLG